MLIGLTALLIVFGASLFRRGVLVLEKLIKPVFWVTVLVVFAWDVWLTGLQYSAWAEGGLTQYFLPGYQEGYFSFYVLFRIFAPHLIALAVSLLWLFVLKRANQRFGGKFFERGEPYLAAFSVFLASHPGWILYITTLLTIYLIWHLSVRVRGGGKEERLPLYSLWPAVGALAVALEMFWLLDTNFWKLLQI